jgi:hypothetical protein
MNVWTPSDMDAFMIETREADYYYALKSALDGKGDHYYKRYKHRDRDIKVEEIEPSEIINLIKDGSEILAKCPCINIIDGKIQPLFSKTEVKK